MYIQSELAKVTQDERLRVAARDQLCHQARAARRARNHGRRRLVKLPMVRVLQGRRPAQAY